MILSLRQKLYATLFIGAILPLTILAFWLARGAERAGTTLLQSQLAGALQNVVRTADQRWFFRRGDLLLLANNQVVIDALARATPPVQPPVYLNDLFNSLDQGIRRVAYHDARGRELWSFGSAVIPAAARTPITRAEFAATTVIHARIPIAHPTTRARLGELRAEVHVNALVPDSLSAGPAGTMLAVFDRRTRALLVPSELPADVLRRRSFQLNGEEWLVARDTLVDPPLAFALAAPATAYIAPFQRVARFGIIALLLVGVAVSALTGWLTARLMRSTFDQLSRTQALAAVGQYAASLSHEVRNALTSIRIDLQRVEQNGTPLSDQQRLLRRALSNILRLDGIVNSSLRIARSGTVERAGIDVREPLTHALQLSEHEFTERGRRARLHIDQPVCVLGNAPALQQLFVNLLLNAAQADGNVEITAQVDSDVAILFTDDGAGVPGGVRKGLPTRSLRPGGSGFGLAIAQNIVQAHHGQLDFESEPGRTVVTVRIPSCPPRPSPELTTT